MEEPLRWDAASQWTFEPVDDEAFPAVGLARAAVSASATHPAVMNAANEVLVSAFRAGAVGLPGITDAVERVLGEHEGVEDPSLEDVEAVERWARERARELSAL